MKKFLNYFLILLIVPVLVLNSCKDDETEDPVVKGTFADLKTYLVNNSMDLPDVLDGWITTAEAIHGKGIADYHIMDIRAAGDFANGYIEGAVNSSLGTIVADAQGVTKPIIVVCYTGQSASHATVALRLSGFADAKVLKWGMSGWNPDFSDSWNNNVGNAAADYPNGWTDDAVTANEDFSFPAWETTSTDGATILAERVAAMTEGGFKGVAGTSVLENPGNYFVNNYWPQEDVDYYGHITDAYRILPLSLENNEMANIDPDSPVVTYCWTGQTSSMVTAYLTVLGYDAMSLKFGVNSMIYDDLEGHKWSAGAVMDYDYVTK